MWLNFQRNTLVSFDEYIYEQDVHLENNDINNVNLGKLGFFIIGINFQSVRNSEISIKLINGVKIMNKLITIMKVLHLRNARPNQKCITFDVGVPLVNKYLK